MLNGYDIDGVLTVGVMPETPFVVISGRTFAEFDDYVRKCGSVAPTYIRGSGAYGDRPAAGEFKALMCRHLGVTTFYEDDPLQADIIRQHCPRTTVVTP